MQSLKIEGPGKRLSYIKSLDGVRAIAAMMVVFFHSPLPAFELQFGWVGVNLFFILSGFLITRILLHIKRQPFRPYLRQFYMRRILRIFPLYFFYLLLAASVLFLLNHKLSGHDPMIAQGVNDLKNNYLYLLTYSYNFESLVNFLQGASYESSFFFGHLWTLAVEEQFYLIFPLFVYFLPLRTLKKVLLVFVLLVPVCRFVAVLLLKENVNDLFWIGRLLYESTIFQLDTLSLGACLAVFEFKYVLKNGVVWLVVSVLVAIAVGIMHLMVFEKYGLSMPLSSLGFDNPVYHLLVKTPFLLLDHRYVYTVPLLNIVFALFLLLLIKRQGGGTVLKGKFIRSIGHLSYGIYIYHLGLSYLFTVFFKEVAEVLHFCKLGMFSQFPLMILYLLALFLLAQLSYSFFERLFLRMKKKYTIKNKVAVPST